MLQKTSALAVLLLLSCSHPQESAPPALPIEGRWPCFNGREIVQQGGLYGLVKESGEPVLPSEYDAIEFLDNDIALLTRGSSCYLSDKNGRILAEGTQTDSLRGHWTLLVEEVLEEDRRSWEEVVQSYETLCKACKAKRGQRLSRREFSSLQALRDAVSRNLRQATGSPTPSQKARLESLSADYRRAF